MYDESDYSFDQRFEALVLSKYGHWKVIVKFESGLTHSSTWHAERGKAQEIVVQEAHIQHERRFGDRGSILTWMWKRYRDHELQRVLPNLGPCCDLLVWSVRSGRSDSGSDLPYPCSRAGGLGLDPGCEPPSGPYRYREVATLRVSLKKRLVS